MKVRVEFERERETKNTVRYAEVEMEEAPAIGTLYVQKHVLRRMGNPDRIAVTIEPAVPTAEDAPHGW